MVMPVGGAALAFHVILWTICASDNREIYPVSLYSFLLNGQRLPLLVARHTPVYAVCRVNVAAAFSFEWGTNESRCSTELVEDILYPGSRVISSTPRNQSVVFIDTANLTATVVHRVQCEVKNKDTWTITCRMFRVFDYYPAPDEAVGVADGKVRLKCGTAVLPIDVNVTVVWSLNSSELVLLNESVLPPSDSSEQLTYELSPEVVLESDGGVYLCSVTNRVQRIIFQRQIFYYIEPIVVVKDAKQASHTYMNKLAVNVTCEALGYPIPTVRLFKGEFEFPGRGSALAIRRGVVVTFEFQEPIRSRPLELGDYSCEAQNAAGRSVAYYGEAAKGSWPGEDARGATVAPVTKSAALLSRASGASTKKSASNGSSPRHSFGATLVHVTASLWLLASWSRSLPFDSRIGHSTATIARRITSRQFSSACCTTRRRLVLQELDEPLARKLKLITRRKSQLDTISAVGF